ncbi:protein kinase family protein, partial [Legionella sp. EUR-108]|uniref:protein kinase family protein n=1 Tax=Legionella maioricensis TaxID=2896528 RepID=UPI0020284648
ELTANAALVTSDALEQNLSTLDFNSRRGLTGAAKEKAKKEELTANAALVTSDALEQNLSTLDFNSQRGLTGTDKEKAKGEELTANAVLITPDSESNALSALTIQESQAKTESEEINFDFHVVRALVDLKPLDVEGFTDEFTSLFIKDFYDQVINRIRDEFDSQVDWSSEKRLQAEGQFVTADPELIVEEENSNSLFSLSIKEKCPGKDEVLVTDNEEFNYDFHVVRALVDLKPLDAERFNDDFNTFYLADLNERIHKKIEKELIRDDLIAAEKTKAENEHLIVAPTLSSYEEGEETALCNLTIKKEIFAQEPAPDEIDFEYHVVRALVDLKPDNMEQFNHDFTSFYLSELNQQIVDSVKKELAQRELIRVEKTQSAGEYLTAAPTLTDYEQENSSLLAFLYQNTDDAFEDYNTLDLDRFTSNLTATVTDLNKQVISSFRELPQSQSEADATTDQVSRADSLSDTDLELDKVYETDDFDVADFLDTPDLQLSDDMQDLLDSLTEEERELLFPQGKGLSSSTVLLNALFPITPDPNSEINLKRVNDNQVKQLLEFFDSQAILGIKSWAKDVIYTFADGTEFHFKHDVFQRARKVTHEGVRYEVISNKALLGEGGFGKIRRVKGTVALDAEQELIQFKQQGSDGKRRVVKVQEHSKYSNPLEDYTRGLEFAKRAGHLAIKEPTVVDNATIMTQTSYTVMDQINGRDLFDVINDDLQGLDVLSTQERIELARALLWALKEQVTDRGIIHRDIKPENIMVDLGPPISVTIIDYDLSIDTPDGQFAGTEGFFAPECLNNPMEVSPKSDNFSLGRVLEELGMCDIPDLDETNKLSIQKIVAGMLEEDPNQRLSIDETIEAFAYIDIEGSGVPYSHWLWDNNWIDGEFVPDALLESIQAADTRLAADEVGEAQQTHEGDKDTDEFDVAAFLASDTQPTEEMQDLLDSLTEEERELLFPRDKELSAKTLLFDDVPRVTNYEHNLFDIILDDYDGIDVLSTDERIELSQALLLALKEQVSDQGFIHQDIRPENIIVRLGSPISVTIINEDLNTREGQFAGTEGYYAPEFLSDPMAVSPKANVYALGRVLALIWRVDFTTYRDSSPYTPDSYRPQDLLVGIGDDIPDLDENNKSSIRKILSWMLENDPNQRLSIDEAIEVFAYIGGEGVPYSHWLWDNNWIDGEFVPDALLESIQAADTRLAADEVGEAQQTHEGDKDTDEFDVAAFLASDTQPTEEMQDLLDSLTEEERELLFPRDKELSAKTLLFDDVPRATNHEHNLFDIILDDYDGIDVLSTDERIELSQALLLALKEQVSDQGFIHQDIRPENIIVRLGSPISVTIINEDVDTPEGQFAGTEGYYPPEFLSDPMAVSPKANVYALGRVLALIWRVDFTTYRDSSPYTPDSYRPQDLLVGIGDDIPDLDENNKSSIRKILSWMLENDPNQRLSIDEAIEVFAYIGGEGVPYSHWLWDNNWIDGEFVPDALLEARQGTEVALATGEIIEERQVHQVDNSLDSISEPLIEVNPLDKVNDEPRELEKPSVSDHAKGIEKTDSKISSGNFRFFQPETSSSIDLSLREKRHKNF